MSVIRIYKTDEQVLQGLKENDKRAWSVMLNDKDLRKMIFSLVIKNSGNEDDAIDVLMGKDIGSEAWTNIILKTRLPQTLTALACGAGLSVAHLHTKWMKCS